MAALVWTAPMVYFSPGDEAAFFQWLCATPSVSRVEGHGRELLIHLRSKRLSKAAAREFAALYRRYGGETIASRKGSMVSSRSRCC